MELIKITNKDGKRAVSMREIYHFLEVKTDFSNWCKRMFKYGFENGVDYSLVRIGERNAHNKTDYAITIDTAKEISMLQRSEKGKQARRYFIECEKKWKQGLPKEMSRMEILQLAMESEKERLRLAEENKVLQPKAEYTDTVLQSRTSWTVTTIAKELGMSAIKLNQSLFQLGVQRKNGDGVWVLYAKHDNRGFTKTKTHAYTTNSGEIKTSISTVWTEKGRNFIHQLLNQNLQNK